MRGCVERKVVMKAMIAASKERVMMSKSNISSATTVDSRDI